MRGGKSFLVLLVIAIGVGAYAYFVESKRDVSDSAATKREKVWTIDAGKIEAIDVKAANGDLTRLKKNGSTWQQGNCGANCPGRRHGIRGVLQRPLRVGQILALLSLTLLLAPELVELSRHLFDFISE